MSKRESNTDYGVVRWGGAQILTAAIPNLKLFLPFYGKVLESRKHRADHDLTSFLVCIFLASLSWGSKYPCVIEPRIHEILIRTGASVLSLAHVIA